jgi:hypothetical protein
MDGGVVGSVLGTWLMTMNSSVVLWISQNMEDEYSYRL